MSVSENALTFIFKASTILGPRVDAKKNFAHGRLVRFIPAYILYSKMSLSSFERNSMPQL